MINNLHRRHLRVYFVQINGNTWLPFTILKTRGGGSLSYQHPIYLHSKPALCSMYTVIRTLYYVLASGHSYNIYILFYTSILLYPIVWEDFLKENVYFLALLKLLSHQRFVPTGRGPSCQ